jgi:hypothetical protein
VAAADAALSLGVGELVPERAAGGVAEPVQRAPAGLHVGVPEPKAAPHLLQHGAPAGVHAEVLERAPEVRDVGAGAAAAGAAEHEGPEELELLRQREHQRAQRRDVRLERVAGDGHELARQRHADAAGAVLSRNTHPKHSSAAPLWVRTVWSRYLASAARLDSSAVALPMRKMQLDNSMERSLPKYQLSVMFSVLTTTA